VNASPRTKSRRRSCPARLRHRPPPLPPPFPPPERRHRRRRPPPLPLLLVVASTGGGGGGGGGSTTTMHDLGYGSPHNVHARRLRDLHQELRRLPPTTTPTATNTAIVIIVIVIVIIVIAAPDDVVRDRIPHVRHRLRVIREGRRRVRRVPYFRQHAQRRAGLARFDDILPRGR